MPLKILVIDDEEGITLFAKLNLSRKGFIVFTANDEATGIDIFKREKPQVCFIDMWMHNGPHSGIELLRQIKEINKDAYCIMMGPCTEREIAAKQLKDLGALHFINNRLSSEDMEQYIEEIRRLIIEKNFTIRDLFHDLGNKHQLIIVGMGAVKESIEECLNEENNQPGLKEKLSAVIKDLDAIIVGAKEADKKALEIEGRVYAAIDSDASQPKKPAA